ncbi:MAG: hypothetical protein KGO53_00590 [Alphaproteobacteria bacterium]|nr:hypothetical protein [Alphaproteobacteria bacterium]
MSLAALILEILAALGRLFSLRSAAQASERERQLGAALQREKDMQDEERRISAAARAGLDAGGLRGPADPLDRDAAT